VDRDAGRARESLLKPARLEGLPVRFDSTDSRLGRRDRQRPEGALRPWSRDLVPMI
jgi:hypothetical protein